MVKGQELAIAALDNLLASKRFPHALLLSGPSGVGKRMLAWLLAEHLITQANSRIPLKQLNELPLSARRSMGEDNSLTLSGVHPDIFFLNKPSDKRDIPVESIRELIGKLYLKSYRGGAKVAIIDDAHLLSNAGANALLMTLEEPPANTFIVLCSHAEHRLPATILSRTQKVTCRLLDDEIISELLVSLGDEGFRNLNKRELLAICDGSLAPLGIEEFRCPLTSKITQPEAMCEHLQQLAEQLSAWETELQCLESEPHAGQALRLSAMVNKSDTGVLLFLSFMRNRLRRQMLQNPDPRKISSLADRLLLNVETERGISERNLNSELQLSHLLLTC